MATNKETEVLEEHEHVLKRPTMYISSVDPTEEKIPIIEDNVLYLKNKMFPYNNKIIVNVCSYYHDAMIHSVRSHVFEQV